MFLKFLKQENSHVSKMKTRFYKEHIQSIEELSVS